MQEVLQEKNRRYLHLEWQQEKGTSLFSACEEQIRFALHCLCDAITENLPSGQSVLLRGEGIQLTFSLPQGVALPLRQLVDFSWEGVLGGSPLPLRLILTKVFIEQNGGILEVDGQGSDTPTLAVRFPFVSAQ
jgi:hypothetical protein